MFSKAEASTLFFFILFPFFPGEWASARGDKPVTVSLQTEEQGAHLKQWHYWPTAIASQHFHERREREGAAVVGGAGKEASKTWRTFRGSEALGRHDCHRVWVIVFFPKCSVQQKTSDWWAKKKRWGGECRMSEQAAWEEKRHFNFQKTYLHNSSITWNHSRLVFFDMLWFVFQD